MLRRSRGTPALSLVVSIVCVACGPTAVPSRLTGPARPAHPATRGDVEAAPSPAVFPSLDVARSELAAPVREGLAAADEAFALPPPPPPETLEDAALSRWTTTQLVTFVARKRDLVDAARVLLHLGRTLGVRDRIVSAAYSGVLAEDLLRTGRFVGGANVEMQRAYEHGFVIGMLRSGSERADGALVDLQLCASLATMAPASMRPWGTFCEQRRTRLLRYLGLERPEEPECEAADTPPQTGTPQTLVLLSPSFGVPLPDEAFEPVRAAELARLAAVPGASLVPLEQVRVAQASYLHPHTADGRHACAAPSLYGDALGIDAPTPGHVLFGACVTPTQCSLYDMLAGDDADLLSAPVVGDPLDPQSWVAAVAHLTAATQAQRSAIFGGMDPTGTPATPGAPPRASDVAAVAFGPWRSQDELRTVVATREAAVARCAPSAHGTATVDVDLVVGRDGRPTRIWAEPAPGSEAAGDCARQALDGMRFPAAVASGERRAIVHVQLFNTERKARATLDACGLHVADAHLAHRPGLTADATQLALGLCFDAYAPTATPDDTAYLWTSLDVGADGHVTAATVLPLAERLAHEPPDSALQALVRCAHDAVLASAWPCTRDGNPVHVSATLRLHGGPAAP